MKFFTREPLGKPAFHEAYKTSQKVSISTSLKQKNQENKVSIKSSGGRTALSPVLEKLSIRHSHLCISSVLVRLLHQTAISASMNPCGKDGIGPVRWLERWFTWTRGIDTWTNWASLRLNRQGMCRLRQTLGVEGWDRFLSCIKCHCHKAHLASVPY